LNDWNKWDVTFCVLYQFFVKKIYFSLTIILLSSWPTFSQLLVGPEVGVNYSWTAFRDDELKERYKIKPVIGFHVGGHIAFRVRKRFFLHASLLYATKGRELKSTMDGLLNSNARYHYIDMPVNYTVDFKGKIGKGKEFKYFLGIGPNISYWLGGKGKFYNSELEEENLGEIRYSIKFNSTDSDPSENAMTVTKANRLQLGLNVVAGLIIEPWAKQRFMFSVHYELGHSYLAKSNGAFSGVYYTEPLRASNQGFRISLAYLVDLKTEERKKGKSTINRKKM
jgi:hypothetical protein